MKNYYAAAIQIYHDYLQHEDLDVLLLEVVKCSPNAIIKAHKKILRDPVTSLDIEVKQIAESEGLIPAIKYLRNKTSIGLKEAKYHVDELMRRR